MHRFQWVAAELPGALEIAAEDYAIDQRNRSDPKYWRETIYQDNFDLPDTAVGFGGGE